MQNLEFNWYTEDGLKIFAQIWKPEKEIRAVVCLIHGLGEHSSRYKELPMVLTESGYAVISHDHRGHGKSEGKRGHTPSYELYLSDITKLLNEAKKHFPGKNLFLYGHSMGGNLVLNYALQFQPDIKGIIATGPWLRLTNPPRRLTIKFAKVLDKFWPSFRTYNGIKPDELSHEKRVVEETRHDEYIHPWISVHTFLSVSEAGCWALENAQKLKYPLLLLHGKSDKVTSPEGSKEFASKVGNKCTLKIFEDFYHEIHNEPRNNEIFRAIKEWLDKQDINT